MNEQGFLPIIDLHCDLLFYLFENKNGTYKDAKMGASLPYLKEGNVALQVMAVYTDVTTGSTLHAQEQINHFTQLFENSDFHSLSIENLSPSKPQALLAIENAAGLCEEDMELENAFNNLDSFISQVGKILYISLTHHTENRFGGGNYSNVGLKDDGKVFLEYISSKKIAIDLAHTSDKLAYGIIDHIDKKNLDIPIIASHSNFRNVFHHVRNLPTELVNEIIKRDGLIGINFLRAYVDNEKPEALIDHILWGINQAPNALSFGADFFFTEGHPDKNRKPFYFTEHENASKYPLILNSLKNSGIKSDLLEKLSFRNARDFIENKILQI